MAEDAAPCDPEAVAALLGEATSPGPGAHPWPWEDRHTRPRHRPTVLALAAVTTAGALATLGLWLQGRGRLGLESRRVLELGDRPLQGKEAWGTDSFVKLVQTARDSGERLAVMPDLPFGPDFTFTAGPTIDIDGSSIGQEMLGFGGAFTEAAAVTLMKLPAEQQEQVLEHYFGAEGLGYTLGRVHINSCDFSVQSYSFDDQRDDFTLASFDDSVAHDRAALIPFIQRAMQKVQASAQAQGQQASSVPDGSPILGNGKVAGRAQTITFIESDEGGLAGGQYFLLQTSSGGFLSANGDGHIVVMRDKPPLPDGRFRLVADSDGNVSLQAPNRRYVTAFLDGSLRAQAKKRQSWEKFVLMSVSSDGTSFALRTAHGAFLSEPSPPPRGLRLLASPWSPPAWMKQSGQMDGSSRPCLRKECQGTWARYIARWLSAYRAQGLPVWALTVQNEPTNPPPWEGCVYTAEEEADFLGQHLGPAVKAAHPDVAIFVYDDSKHLLPVYVDAAMRHPNASKYVDGAAFHWYSGDLFNNIAQVKKKSPQLALIGTEATYERRMWLPNRTTPYADWRFGEGYAHDIIGDLNAGAGGWIDWNLLLDMGGGPNHVGNSCDAAILADVASGQLHIHPQFYYIGHFSKYIPPGSRHVVSTVSASPRAYRTSTKPGPYGTCTGQFGLEVTSFRRMDGWIVAVVLNCAAEQIDFKLRYNGKAAKASIPAHAIQTFSIPA